MYTTARPMILRWKYKEREKKKKEICNNRGKRNEWFGKKRNAYSSAAYAVIAFTCMQRPLWMHCVRVCERDKDQNRYNSNCTFAFFFSSVLPLRIVSLIVVEFSRIFVQNRSLNFPSFDIKFFFSFSEWKIFETKLVIMVRPGFAISPNKYFDERIEKNKPEWQ